MFEHYARLTCAKVIKKPFISAAECACLWKMRRHLSRNGMQGSCYPTFPERVLLALSGKQFGTALPVFWLFCDIKTSKGCLSLQYISKIVSMRVRRGASRRFPVMNEDIADARPISRAR